MVTFEPVRRRRVTFLRIRQPDDDPILDRDIGVIGDLVPERVQDSLHARPDPFLARAARCGSSRRRRLHGRDGIVTVDQRGNEVYQDFQPPGIQAATNQQMELTACVQALQLIAGRHSPVDVGDYKKVVIYTDSRSVAHLDRSVVRQPLQVLARQGPELVRVEVG